MQEKLILLFTFNAGFALSGFSNNPAQGSVSQKLRKLFGSRNKMSNLTITQLF